MPKAKSHLYRAEDLFEKRDLQGAKEELQEAIKADPNMLDAHKALAHVDEYLGDEAGAAKEYTIAEQLDPADAKLRSKASYYRQIIALENAADEALKDVRAGKLDAGMAKFKEILTATNQKGARERTVAALRKAIPAMDAQAEAAAQNHQFGDAVNAYSYALRASLLVSQATGKTQLSADESAMIRQMADAARAAHSSVALFDILNDLVAFDPEDKTANNELAQVYLARTPPDYSAAADLLERAGASDAEVKTLRDRARANGKRS